MEEINLVNNNEENIDSIEKNNQKSSKKNQKNLIKKMSLTAMFIAMAYVLAFIANTAKLTVFPGLPFLTYDPKDALICIASFILGPYIGMGISVAVAFLELITFSSTGIYGFIMNSLATCSIIAPAAFIYQFRRTYFAAIIALSVGFISGVIFMTLWNIIITPIYLDADRNIIVNDYLGSFILFNVIKDGINVSLVLLLYKPIVSALRKVKLVGSPKVKLDKQNTLFMVCLSLLVLISLGTVWFLLTRV